MAIVRRKGSIITLQGSYDPGVAIDIELYTKYCLDNHPVFRSHWFGDNKRKPYVGRSAIHILGYQKNASKPKHFFPYSLYGVEWFPLDPA